MKKFLLITLFPCSAFAQAGEVTVLERDLMVDSFRSLVDTRFYIDQETHEGFAKIAVSEERYVPGPMGGYYPYPSPYPRGPFPGGYYPRPMPMPVQVVVFEATVKIDGLMLVGDKVIYHAPEGEVDCGTMGTSRILKRPTLYLSGKCSLDGQITGTRRDTRLTVTLKTK